MGESIRDNQPREEKTVHECKFIISLAVSLSLWPGPFKNSRQFRRESGWLESLWTEMREEMESSRKNEILSARFHHHSVHWFPKSAPSKSQPPTACASQGINLISVLPSSHNNQITTPTDRLSFFLLIPHHSRPNSPARFHFLHHHFHFSVTVAN